MRAYTEKRIQPDNPPELRHDPGRTETSRCQSCRRPHCPAPGAEKHRRRRHRQYGQLFHRLPGRVQKRFRRRRSELRNHRRTPEKHGIPVYDLNAVNEIEFYVDGADETNERLELIKGGGGGLTRGKNVAAVAKTFICIADESKMVGILGEFPLPVEVIPMARSHVGREIVKLGGDPVYRDGFVTDNGNIIIDIHNMDISRPIQVEERLNNIVGVVTNGLFARRPADLLLLGTSEGVKSIARPGA